MAHAVRIGSFDSGAVDDLTPHRATDVFPLRLARVHKLLDRKEIALGPGTIAAGLGNGVAAHDSVPAAVWLAATADARRW